MGRGPDAAIGLNLVFGIPLEIGVFITAANVFLILWLQARGFRWVEAFIMALIGVIAVCFGVQIALADPVWADVIAGFAPTTFHALGSRLAAAELRGGFHVSITNVPGPQFPLYADGARMLESYPVHPLLPDHPLAIGVTSYDGGVFYGITADRDAVPDADVIGQCVLEALEELNDSASDSRPRAPRGRKK